MRNLKKILALVLALIMSLSLMATAGASSFPDVDDENPYATAIEVLDKLKVFQGYKEDGTFRPTETLNRAQAAVLVYRIATGDVEDKYLENYTFMQQSKFEDLDGYNWAKGYINYCQNAEIVVGTSATTFEPGAKVTGYQLLVMLLRTLGYGKAGEFSDPKGWELQTAAIAEREGILKNVTQGDLGAAAPRQMVAEILFRGLLTEKVAYSPLAANGYTKTGKTLGQEQFGLEQVEGVVMANEWANLNENTAKGNKVLPAGKTEMKIAKVQDVGATVEVGKIYTLDYSTDLDAVGLNHIAYIAGKSGDKQVLTIEATGNVVDYNEGKAKSVSSLATTKLTNDTEWFINYDQEWFEEAKSDIIIRYSVDFESIDQAYTANNITAGQRTTWKSWLTDAPALGGAPANTVTNAVKDGKTFYTRTIRPGTEITEIDQEIMREIFYSADKQNVIGWLKGEVYAGTQTTDDASDTMSWVAFVDKYFKTDVNTKKFGDVGNGDSLRIIDNNGDGDAEYVLKIAYTQAKAVDTLNDALLLSSGVQMSKYTDNNLDSHDELALNDIVNYYIIDGKLSIWKADIVTDTVKTKNFKDVTVTLSDGTEKGQSAIKNATSLDDNILDMSDKPEYNMYLDEYGYIRTYELAQGKKYALLTEMYGGTYQNWNYINTNRWTVEIKAGEEALTERAVANRNGNTYTGSTFATLDYAWTSRTLTLNGGASTTSSYNYLQPATAHLDIAANIAGNVRGAAVGTTPVYRDLAWNRNVFAVAQDDMFDYGPVTYTTLANGTAAPVANRTAADSFSFTNVATYTMEDEAVWLESASKLHTNTSGEQLFRSTVVLMDKDIGTVLTKAQWKDAWKSYNKSTVDADAEAWFNARLVKPANARSELYYVYATDYVQLSKTQSYAPGTRHYTIDEDYGVKYNTLSNEYVDATVNTEYYIVSRNKVDYVVGYDNLLKIAAADVRAAYAVAQNTARDANGKDYWVADVIVIEVNTIDYDYDSISLMYYNPWETSGQVRNVSSLNNAWRTLQPEFANKAMLDVIPTLITRGSGSVIWGNAPWSVGTAPTYADSDYGFYRLYNTDPKTEANGTLTAADARKITSNYNSYGIFAGTVKRITEIYSTSGYIDIEMNNGVHKYVTVTGSAYNTPVYRVSISNGVTTAAQINLLNDPNMAAADVKLEDDVIVVYPQGGSVNGQAAFIVDIEERDDNRDGKKDWEVPTWLETLWTDIYTDVPTTGSSYDYTITVNCVDTAGKTLDTKKFNVNKGGTIVFQEDYSATVPNINIPGYTLSTFTKADGTAQAPTSGSIGGSAVWNFYNVQANATYTATYNAATLTFQLTGDGGASARTIAAKPATVSADANFSSPIAIANNNYIASDGTNGTPVGTRTVAPGDQFRFVFTLNPGYSYTVTGTGFTVDSEEWTTATTYTVTGTITGNVAAATLNVAQGGALPTTTVTFPALATGVASINSTATTNGGAALDVDGANTMINGKDIDFTIVPATGYSVASVTYTQGAVADAVHVSGNTYRIPGGVVNGTAITTVTITMTYNGAANAVTGTTITNAITSAPGIDYKISDATNWTPNSTTGSISLGSIPAGGSVTIKSTAAIDVKVASGATVTPVRARYEYTVSNFTANGVTITVDYAAPLPLSVPITGPASLIDPNTGVVTVPTDAGVNEAYTYVVLPNNAAAIAAIAALDVDNAKTALDSVTGATALVATTDVTTGTSDGLIASDNNVNLLVLIKYNTSANKIIAVGQTLITGIDSTVTVR